MKITKYFVLLAIAACGVLSSCDTDNEGTIYTTDKENVSFEVAEPSEVLTNNAKDTIQVRLIRSNVKSDYTAHYTFETADEGIFTDTGNGTVTFKAGEGSKTVDIIADNLEPGVECSATLTLSDADISTADTITNTQVAATTITIIRNYVWESAGSGKFTDYTFSENGASATVNVEHAQGTSIYRLIQPYAMYDGVKNAGNITFTLDKNYAASMNDGQYTLGDGIGYSMYYASKKYPSYCNISNTGDLYTFNFLVTDGSGLYPGGQFTFEWTTGWPGSK